MAITSILFSVVARDALELVAAAASSLLTAPFLVVDLSFLVGERGEDRARRLGAARHRASAIYTLMSTWKRGRCELHAHPERTALPLDLFLTEHRAQPALRVPGTAVFMTSTPTACRWCCCTTSSTTRCCTRRSCC